MGVDGGIASSTCEILVLSIGDVEVRLGIAVLLSQTEVNNVDLIASLSDAHEKVVGLDIAVNEGLGMDVFDAGDELVSQQQDGLQREFPVAEVEEIFERGTEKVKDHGVVVTLGAKPADEGDTHATGQGLVDACLIFELGVLGLDRFELDSDLLTRDDVGSKIDVTEGTTANLAANAVFVTDTKILLCC